MESTEVSSSRSRRGVRDYLAILFKGAAMGAADVIPGVSGGTIAFISGIYEELLASIKGVDAKALGMLCRLQFGAFWQKVNGSFLAAVFGGVLLSIVSLAKVMTYLLASYPILVWSFFFGLIIASSILVFKQVKSFNLLSALSIVVGASVAYFITVLSPTQTPTDWWFIFLCGAVAICAMILPGVSGSFILLLMGKYIYILTALSSFDIVTIILFGGGAVVGLVSFSHILSWLLVHQHTATVSLLTGFMIGSLNKVWPWKEVVETTLNSHGEMVPLVERNLWPMQYEAVASLSSQLYLAIVMAIIGFSLIYLIEWVGARMKRE